MSRRNWSRQETLMELAFYPRPPFPGRTGTTATPRSSFLPERSGARSPSSASRSPASRRATQTELVSASPTPPGWADKS